MIMKIITELHGGLGHESSREGRGGHIGFDKWTVKVPIWPSLWLFLPALLSTLVLNYPSFIPFLCSPVGQCKSELACSERLTECKPNLPLWRRKEVEK